MYVVQKAPPITSKIYYIFLEVETNYHHSYSPEMEPETDSLQTC